jgi:hypothetical protein
MIYYHHGIYRLKHHNSYYSYIILIRASKVYKRGAESSSQPSDAGDITTMMKE